MLNAAGTDPVQAEESCKEEDKVEPELCKACLVASAVAIGVGISIYLAESCTARVADTVDVGVGMLLNCAERTVDSIGKSVDGGNATPLSHLLIAFSK